jgi:hypothetical protein
MDRGSFFCTIPPPTFLLVPLRTKIAQAFTHQPMSTSSPPSPQFRSQINHPPTNRQALRWMWTLFPLCALAAIGLFFVPAFIIRPFRHQAPRGLLLAMALRQRAPLGTLIAGLACIVLACALWRTVGRWRKALLALTLLVVTFSAVMARLNYFEWMFHPIVGPQFLGQSESKLDGKEMILAVRFGNDARAYPISQMAYHHVLNDVVGGVPIAVTY